MGRNRSNKIENTEDYMKKIETVSGQIPIAEKEHYISKSDSKALYGIAIILMVFHHCFCIPSRLNYNYIPLLGGFETEARIAWIGKLCVAIYAFVSGYAFAAISDRNGATKLWDRLRANVITSLQTLIKFYSKFWLVFLIYVPIGIVFFGKSSAPKDILNGLLRGGGYCGEWWYVFQYIKFLIVFPFLELVIFWLKDKEKRKYAIISIVAGFCIIAAVRAIAWNSFAGKIIRFGFNQFYSHYMVIFLVAFVMGKYRIYESISKYVSGSITLIVMLSACVVFRWFFVTHASQSNCDVFLAPILIFSLVGILHKAKSQKIISCLAYLGKYSIYMWLIHTFWIYYYFQNIILLPRYSLLIFIWALAISLINAILLDQLYKAIGNTCGGIRKIITKENQKYISN